MLVSGKNLTEAKQHCNDILDRFYNYFTLNKLSINTSKTKFMIYKPVYGQKRNKHMHDTTTTKLTMNNLPLRQVSSIKFLGVMINDKLTWDCHKQLICNKISKTLEILNKCKNIMNENDCIKMYKTFVQPYFLYAIEAWGYSMQSDNDILVKAQSKALRILFDSHRTTDAWKYTNGKIKDVRNLYTTVIKKLCMKHHYGM